MGYGHWLQVEHERVLEVLAVDLATGDNTLVRTQRDQGSGLRPTQMKQCNLEDLNLKVLRRLTPRK